MSFIKNALKNGISQGISQGIKVGEEAADALLSGAVSLFGKLKDKK